MSILQICSQERLSQGNRKEIQSLSLLGHWLKSCLFQQWPKLITIQACCSVTNSMWKELVASEAVAHCWQSQQKDQGFGWTLNMNFSSAQGIGPCPSNVPGAPTRQYCLGLLDRPRARRVAVSRPGLPGLPASCSHLAYPHATPWPARRWGLVGEALLPPHQSHSRNFYPGFSLTVGQKI